MATKRHSAEQIVRKLREAEVEFSAAVAVVDRVAIGMVHLVPASIAISSLLLLGAGWKSGDNGLLGVHAPQVDSATVNGGPIVLRRERRVSAPAHEG